MQRKRQLTAADRFAQVFWSVVVTVGAFIPSWLFLGAWFFVSPTGFLQWFLLVSLGSFLAIVQFLAFVGWAFCLYYLWTDF